MKRLLVLFLLLAGPSLAADAGRARTWHFTAQPASISYTSGTGKAVAAIFKTNTGTKNYKLYRVRVAVGTITAAQALVELRWITADGTATAATPVAANRADAALDANFAAKHTYTVEPTYLAGTPVSALSFSTTTANNFPSDVLLLYDHSMTSANPPLTPITLRNGQSEGLAVFVTLTGTTPAAIFRVTFIFTEEP